MRVLLLKVLYPLLALSSFINPFYGVLYYALITVIRPESLTWGGSTIKNVSFMAIACLALSSVMKRTVQIQSLTKGFFISFLMFYAFLFLATWKSPTTYISMAQENQTFEFVRQILIMFVYCLCVYSVIKHDLKKTLIFINALMLMFLFMGIWGVQQRFHGNMLVEGLFGNAIKDRCAITGIFVLVFPLGLFNFRYPYNNKKLWKYLGLVSMVFFVLMIFFTDSRAGFLGFVFCLMILGISMKNKVRNTILIVVCLFIAFPMLPENYQERIKSIGKAKGGTEDIDHSAGSRLVMWQSALLIFKDNLLLGVGNLNFPEVAYDRRNYFINKISPELFDYTFQENFKLQCHNMFLNVFAEGGLLTAIPFYLMIAFPMLKALHLRKIGMDPKDEELFRLNRLLFFLFAGMMGYLLTCAFANMRFIDYFYWILTVILIVGEILEKKANELKNKSI